MFFSKKKNNNNNNNNNLKLATRYYVPFEIMERMGKVAYKLKLPVSS
ncbi:MAG: hypothetical protein N7Q72_04125 [Spiroplasma sp. Tabriz.8]|nr:hypothetical protein [Spiroplasma sp. Tabriz.8]